MKKLLTLFLIVIFYSTAIAQTKFMKTYTFQEAFSRGYSGLQTFDGGYILLGMIPDGSNSNFYFVKTDSNGDTLWTKQYCSSEPSNIANWGYFVKQTSDSGYVATGYTGTSVSGYIQDIFVIRTNSIGDTLWTKTFGVQGGSAQTSSKIYETDDNGFIIGGYHNPGTGAHAYILKLDSHGNLIWQKYYNFNIAANLGGIKQTFDKGYIITGETSSGGKNIFLSKLDAIGNIEWVKYYQNGTNLPQKGFDLIQLPDSGYIVASAVNRNYTSPFTVDCWILRTNAIGDTLWTKFYPDFWPHCINTTIDNGYVITGHDKTSNGIGVLYKLDNKCDTIWTRKYDIFPSCNLYEVHQTTDKGFIMIGTAKTIDVHALMIKTDSLGNSVLPTVDITADSKKVTLTIFPNPFSIQTHIKTTKLIKNATLKVINSFGQTVTQIENIHEQIIVFNRGNLQNGLYFIQLIQDCKVIATKKLVIIDK